MEGINIINHVTFSVPKSKFDGVVSWYLAACAPLKWEKLMDFGDVVGLGPKGKPQFWISKDENDSAVKSTFHVAFHSDDHETVDKFHKAALKAGGKDNGKPGIREDYHPTYYAAFVFDPIGNNVEVVDHRPD